MYSSPVCRPQLMKKQRVDQHMRKSIALGHARRACVAHRVCRVALASATPRIGVWDPCENPGIQPNDWNSGPLSEWQGAGPGDSGDSVNDPNVPVWLTPIGPNVLGGLNGPNVRQTQSTNKCVLPNKQQLVTTLCLRVRSGLRGSAHERN